MSPDDHAEDESFKLQITDKRRFTEDGAPRDGEGAEDSEEPAPEVQPTVEPGPAAAAAPEPAPTEEASPSPEGGLNDDSLPEMGMQDIGIQAVFLAFWQSVMMNLGAPDPSGRSMPPNLEGARESITLLQVLQEKTRGNLSAEEDEMLKRLIHEAKMGYLEVSGAGGAQ